MTGMRFGKLTVIRQAGSNKFRKVCWECKCDCGNTKVVCGAELRNGKVKSCGCSKKSLLNKSELRIHRIWYGIVDRCTNKNNHAYEKYGGRGIQVCDEWKQFEPFLEWANGSGYDNNLTIDRIDNMGGYCPTNCRWVTMREQANNRRGNTLLSYNGETHTLSEWSEIYNLGENVITERLKIGWSVVDAITKPVRAKRSK
jgi:hypothetical protein